MIGRDLPVPLCWKCQALFNSQYPKSVVVTETNETRREPEKKQIRLIKTSDLVEKSSLEGCPVCLQLLHSLSIPMRAALRRCIETTTARPDSYSLVNEQDLFLSEGHRPCLSLHVVLNKPTLISESEEIKCLLQLYPASGMSPQLSIRQHSR